MLNEQHEVTGQWRQMKDTQYLKDPAGGWFAVLWDRLGPTYTETHGTAFAVKKLQALLLATLRSTKRLPKIPKGEAA